MKKSFIEKTIEFHEFYQENILPLLVKYESYRIETYKRLKKYRACVIIAYTISLACFLCSWIFLDKFSVWVTLFIFSTLLFISTMLLDGFFVSKYITKERHKFSCMLKQQCLEKIIKLFGDITIASKFKKVPPVKNQKNITPEQSALETKNEIQTEDWHNREDLWFSGLFPDFDAVDVDDEFCGNYNGVNFKISEVCLREGKKAFVSDNGVFYCGGVVFKGIIFSLSSNKIIDNQIIISTKGDFVQKDSWIYIAGFLFIFVLKLFFEIDNFIFRTILIAIFIIVTILLKRVSANHIKKVQLPKSKFSEKFNIYTGVSLTDNTSDINQFLTPDFLEKFQKLNTVFDTNKAKCSLFDNKIMFAIKTKKNLFEIGTLDKSLKDPRSINDFYNELTAILKIIEDFSHN